MGTSGSTDNAADWIAGASVYSGRPDPTWPVDPDTAAAIVALATLLAPGGKESEQPPALGYRGSWLRAPDGREWHAAAGVVIGPGGRLADDERRVELAILGTAPSGVVPDFAR